MLHFQQDSSHASSHRGAGGRPPSLSESPTAHSGVWLMPNALSESWLQLGALGWLGKAGFCFAPGSSILQKTEIKPPNFRLQQRVKGHQRCGQSEVTFLFPQDAFGRPEVPCWSKAVVLSTKGFQAKAKHFT